MNVSIDFLSQVPRMLRELIAIVQEPLDRRRQRRSEFFDREIGPAHDDMVAINKDYMESFSELLDLLNRGEDLERIIELLKMKRLVMLNTRKDRAAFAEVLAGARKTSYLKQREVDTFIKYDEAIRAYLLGASPVDARVTWYTDFINEFERIARSGQFPNDHFSSITTSRPPVEIVRDAYSQAIQTDIPGAWQGYSHAYHQLRLELKR